MAWIQIADFDGVINGQKMTVRLTKSDDTIKPKYTIAIGHRPDPNPFRPFLRGDLLAMAAGDSDNTGLTVLYGLLSDARAKMSEDTAAHNAALKKAESERIAALQGKRGGDPKANSGLSRFKKKTSSKGAQESG